MIANMEAELTDYLKEVLGEDLLEVYKQRDKRLFVKVKPAAVRRAVEALRKKYRDMRFMTLSAVDHGLDIEYLYHLDLSGIVLTIRSVKSKEDNTLESIADIFPAANFIEREISDLFGIKLSNHPEPDYGGLILTKDYPEDKRPLRKPFERTDVPSKARPVVEALISSSCVAPISTFIQKKRKGASLPESAPFAFTDKETLKEFHEFIRSTSLDAKVGFDWEKKRLRYK